MSAPYPTLNALLSKALDNIEVTDGELSEARARRSAIAEALKAEFRGSRTYNNGSVAHGDALTPLTDVDLGVVVSEATDTHGPGLKGPAELKERAANAIREHLKPTYGDLRVEVEGRKRSIMVRFNDPISPGLADFTADVIVAVDNVHETGLYIPRFSTWDRSAPEEHTRMILQAIKDTQVTYARTVRLLKHWNHTNGKHLCSWNIKALALDCIDSPMTLLEGLKVWFEYAASELAQAETSDPCGVSDKPIKVNTTRTQAANALKSASERLKKAALLERDGYPVLAYDQLARLFNDEDMLPKPDQDAVRSEEARRIKDLPGVSVGSTQPRIPVRSWAP